MGRFFYLRPGLICLQLVFVAYGSLVWSFYLRLKLGLVFLAYGGKSDRSFSFQFPASGNWVWSFLLPAPPPSGNWVWSNFFAYSPPTESKKTSTVSNKKKNQSHAKGRVSAFQAPSKPLQKAPSTERSLPRSLLRTLSSLKTLTVRCAL